jgi:lipoprotein-anchoring transpeptidase ErfK/SrfK
MRTTKGVRAMKTRSRAIGAVAALGGLVLIGGLTACGTADAAAWHGDRASSSAGPAKSSTAAPPAATINAPADGATNVSTAVELGLTGPAPKTAAVTVTDASGAPVTGSVRPDGSTWVPAAQLKYATRYTASVAGGSKVSFTTMAKPAKTVSASLWMKDGATYGVAMPVVVKFGSSIPKEQRAGVERRLQVISDPPQVGAWNWYGGDEVHFRPKEYWQSGTKLTVRLGTGGLAMAKGYGAKDVVSHATIGDRIEMVTDDSTHKMTVTKNGQVLKVLPVSLGKKSTPSSSGTMVIIEKHQDDLFVSTDPKDPYRTPVHWTQRLTWSGQYIHAAPWSEGEQGKRNVSHGCTNVSLANGKWLFNLTHIGDPVTVKGTPRKLDWGNGWTDWNRSWSEYLKGSALPAPDTTASASPSAPGTATPAADDGSTQWNGGMDSPG